MAAASSLECPSEIALQNRQRSARCNTGGLPGERSFARSDRSDFNFLELINTSDQDVLRRLVEFTQYCSADFQKALSEYVMRSSMSRKGNCWDNAPTESLWGSLKVGRLHGRRFDTRRGAMDEIVDWLGFYNHRRLHSSLGYVSPMEFERPWLAAQQRQAA
jgi:putative transposase